MQVEDIKVLSCRTSLDGQNISGQVAFAVSGRNGLPHDMIVSCTTPTLRKIPTDALLIGDAIRQLRRLPQVKSGLTRLCFAPDLRPLSTSRAA